jgi:hypothetical protein
LSAGHLICEEEGTTAYDMEERALPERVVEHEANYIMII